jgi:hypothetical protein
MEVRFAFPLTRPTAERRGQVFVVFPSQLKSEVIRAHGHVLCPQSLKIISKMHKLTHLINRIYLVHVEMSISNANLEIAHPGTLRSSRHVARKSCKTTKSESGSEGARVCPITCELATRSEYNNIKRWSERPVRAHSLSFSSVELKRKITLKRTGKWARVLVGWKRFGDVEGKLLYLVSLPTTDRSLSPEQVFQSHTDTARAELHCYLPPIAPPLPLYDSWRRMVQSLTQPNPSILNPANPPNISNPASTPATKQAQRSSPSSSTAYPPVRIPNSKTKYWASIPAIHTAVIFPRTKTTFIVYPTFGGSDQHSQPDNVEPPDSRVFRRWRWNGRS